MSEKGRVIMQQPSRWAIVVGVDRYTDDPVDNLRGAVNDAVLMYRFFCDSMHVPENNIQLFLERDPRSPPSIPDPPSRSPTTIGILTAIDNVIQHANPGDLVHIHFAGHGDRMPTAHNDKKPSTAQDEVLCFPNDELLDDVEFGEKLDEIVSSGLVVSVILDCCFSGGATRGGYSGSRCRPQRSVGPRPGGEGLESRSASSADDSRNATLQKGWLYRNRDYNVLAACQPFETAGERPDSSTGQMHGVFTLSLLARLRELGNRRGFTTYGELQGYLDATMKGIIRSVGADQAKSQHPMLLGPQERVIFDSITLDTSQSFAHAVSVSQDLIVLDRGLSSGARVSDVYRLWDLRKPRTIADQGQGIEVTVVSVREFESDATITTNPGSPATLDLRRSIAVGWAAELIRRTEVVQARVVHDGGSPSAGALKEIQDTWKTFVDPTVPVNLDFSGPAKGPLAPRYHVHVGDDVLRITDANDNAFEHLIAIPTSHEEVAERLMASLAHLHSFLSISEIAIVGRPQHDPSVYTSSITETDRPDDDESVVSSWEIEIQNHSPAAIFAVVLNFTPLYGIQQLIPEEVGRGHPIESGAPMSSVVDISLPPSLAHAYKNNPDFRMKDMLKIFISREPVDLGHFKLPDLEVALLGDKDEKVPLPSVKLSGTSWYIEEKEIITVHSSES